MSFGLPKAENCLCFNKMLICTTSYLSINLGYAYLGGRLAQQQQMADLFRKSACSRSGPIPTKKLVIFAPNLPSGDAREKALSTVSQSLGEDDKFTSGHNSLN